MSWIQLNVSVVNGSNVVTVNNNLSTAKVRVGDALILSGFQPVEIIGVYATSLTIASNWENSAQNGAMAAVMPTFGDFDNAAATMRQFTQTTQGNFAAMEAWWTQQSGTVTFKGQDGAEHQVRSAKQMDQDVQEKTDAVQAVTDEMVSLVGAQVALTQPDVYIPFNDSLQIVRGYGTHDKIDVSPAQDGSLLVDLPTKAVDFSRASGRWHTNKSGEVVFIDVDEPGIGIDGIDCMQSYTNNVTYSENIRSDFGWSQNAGTVINYGVEDPKGEMTASEFTVQSSNQGVYKINSLPSSSANVSIYARVTEGEASLLLGAGNDRSILTINEKWQRLSHQGDGTGTNNFICYCSDIGKTVQLAMAQATETKALMPYVTTEGSAVAVSADVVSAQIRNNLPAPGSSFSVSFQSTVKASGSSRNHFSIGDSNTYIATDIQPIGGIRVQHSLGSWFAPLLNFVEKDISNICLRYEVENGDSTISIFQDGVLLGSETYQSMILEFDNDDLIRLGATRSGAVNLNAPISNFKIHHYALSDDEILAMGAPKR